MVLVYRKGKGKEGKGFGWKGGFGWKRGLDGSVDVQLWSAEGVGHVAVGFCHFGGSFGFFLFGEESCFGLLFDGFGALGFGVEGGFCFLLCAVD